MVYTVVTSPSEVVPKRQIHGVCVSDDQAEGESALERSHCGLIGVAGLAGEGMASPLEVCRDLPFCLR